jgi:TPR repeat protein
LISNPIRVHPFAVALLFLLAAGLCFATPLQDAISAKDRGDFAVAFNQFKQLATSGDAAAQFQLSLLYDSGRGTPQDAKSALYWLRMSATHGNPQAQSNLGVAFSKGRGVVQDPIRAYAWFAAAAASGDSVAITNRDVIAKKLTEQQATQAKALLIQCQSTGFTPCL